MSVPVPINQLVPYFGDPVRSIFLTPFNISESDVKEAMTASTQVEEVVAGPKKITLVLAPAKPGIAHSALMIQGEVMGSSLIIEYALRVPDRLAGDPRVMSGPLRCIEALANAYGLEFNIAERRTRFIHQELIPLNHETNVDLMTVHAYPGAVYASSSEIRVYEKSGRKFAACWMVFLLDAAVYKKALGI